MDHILENVCGLNPEEHRELITLIKHAHLLMVGWDRNVNLGRHLQEYFLDQGK